MSLTPLLPWSWKMRVLRAWLARSYYRPCGLSHLIPTCEPHRMLFTGNLSLLAVLCILRYGLRSVVQLNVYGIFSGCCSQGACMCRASLDISTLLLFSAPKRLGVIYAAAPHLPP